MLMGTWQGKMRASFGDYEFRLSISNADPRDLAEDSGSRNGLRAVAIHDRNGQKEVIELKGIVYSDRSVYFHDVNDPLRTNIDMEDPFSRLQFLMKYDRGKLILDGHWQEYHTKRRFRKGRLVLRKQKVKA
jgi:hypothetical protein